MLKPLTPENPAIGTLKADGIGHLNLRVSDLEKSRLFYKEIFGMRDGLQETDMVFLWCGEDLLALAKSEKTRIVTDTFHFGFRVRIPSEVGTWREWLVKKGVHIEKEHNFEDYRGVTIKDPDGYVIEVFYERKPVDAAYEPNLTFML